MDDLQKSILHDLKKIASVIQELDNAVGGLIGDLDKVVNVKGGKYGIRCDREQRSNK